MAYSFSVLSLLSLFGCGGGKATGAPEDIVEISMSYAHMGRDSIWSYTLRETDGAAFFSGRYYGENAQEIVFEDVPVDATFMEQAREIAKTHGFAEMEYRKPGFFQRQISDAPMASLWMYWMQEERGVSVPTKELELNYHPTGADELKALFVSLTELYADSGVPVEEEALEEGAVARSGIAAEGDLFSLTLSSGELPWYNSYAFHLRERDSVFLFDASCAMDDGYTTRQITMESAVVTQEDMDTLRAMCGEYFAGTQLSSQNGGSPSGSSAMVEAGWQNGAWLKLNGSCDYDIERELLLFFGELTARVKNAEPRQESPAKLLSLRISQSGGMAQPFSYHLREEGGRVLFDVRLIFSHGELREATLENAVALDEDMETIRALCDEYGLHALASGGSPSSSESDTTNAVDKSDERMELVWDDGSILSANSFLGVSPAFTIYLDSLYNRLATPPAQGSVTRLYLSSSEGGFYHLYEEDGNVLFSTSCSVEERDIELTDAAATAADMDALNALCEEYGFAEQQQSYRPHFPSYEPYPDSVIHHNLEVTWENGARLKSDSLFESEDALRAFLSNLALRLESGT